MSDFYVLKASDLSLSISASMTYVVIDSFSEGFSKLNVEVSDEKIIAGTSKSGNMFLLNCAGSVIGISLVKEKLSKFSNGIEKWSCKTDVAIVVHLQNGFIVLRLVSHSAEAILVEFVRDFSLESFEKPSSRFENVWFDSYVSTFELKSIR